MRAAQAQGFGGLGLAAWHSQQASAQGFGVVGAYVQTQGHYGGGEVGQVQARHQHRQGKVHEQDLHQQRRAADGPDVEAGNPAHSHPAGSAGQCRYGAQHQADCATDEREPQGGAGAIREGLGVGANGLGKEREHLAQERQGQHHEHQRGDKGGIAALLAGPGLRPEGDKHE